MKISNIHDLRPELHILVLIYHRLPLKSTQKPIFQFFSLKIGIQIQYLVMLWKKFQAKTPILSPSNLRRKMEDLFFYTPFIKILAKLWVAFS